MTRVRRLVVPLGIACGLAAASPAVHALTVGPLHHQTVRDTVSGSVTRLSVSNDVGDITVVPGSVTRIAAFEQYSFKPPTVSHSLRGGLLEVDARCPRTAGPVDVGLNECAADLVITVPRDVTVDAIDGDGDIRTRDLRGAETLRSDAGDITVERVAASALSCRSSDGDVHLSAVRVKTVALATDTGEISADVATLPRSVVARSSDGDIALTVPTGTYAVDAHSVDGTSQVRGITVERGARRTLSARTDEGDIHIAGR